MSGNGIDAASVYGLLREMAKAITALQDDMSVVKQNMATKQDLAALRAETQADIGGLRQAVTGYHATVMGHGILYSELDERVRRIERRLDMGAPS